MQNLGRSIVVAAFGITSTSCWITPREDAFLVTVSLPISDKASATSTTEAKLALPKPHATARSVSLTRELSNDLPRNAWDKTGLFYLSVFPKFLRLAIEYRDYELKTATWPDPESNSLTEGNQGEVTLEMNVSPGKGRYLRATGFYARSDPEHPEQTQVIVFREPMVQKVELIAGMPTEMDVTLEPEETGEVNLAVQLEDGWLSERRPVAISLIDAKAQVVFPPISLVQSSEGAYTTTVRLPVGRPYWSRVFMRDGNTEKLASIDLRTPTFTAATATDRTSITLLIASP